MCLCLPTLLMLITVSPYHLLWAALRGLAQLSTAQHGSPVRQAVRTGAVLLLCLKDFTLALTATQVGLHFACPLEFGANPWMWPRKSRLCSLWSALRKAMCKGWPAAIMSGSAPLGPVWLAILWQTCPYVSCLGGLVCLPLGVVWSLGACSKGRVLQGCWCRAGGGRSRNGLLSILLELSGYLVLAQLALLGTQEASLSSSGQHGH